MPGITKVLNSSVGLILQLVGVPLLSIISREYPPTIEELKRIKKVPGGSPRR